MPIVGREILPPSMAKKAWLALSPAAKEMYKTPEELRYILTDTRAPLTMRNKPRKTNQLTLRLTEEEKSMVAAEAKAANMSQSDFLMMLVMLYQEGSRKQSSEK